MARKCDVTAGDVARAQTRAEAACGQVFRPGPNAQACKAGVEIGTASLRKEIAEEPTVTRPMTFKIQGVGLGFFRECDRDKPGDAKGERCPKGFESVVLKRDDDGVPRVCVCRLGPDHRKKFRGQKKREEDRKPFGSEKKPKHLRRCIELHTEGPRKGQCKRRGPPGVTPRSI